MGERRRSASYLEDKPINVLSRSFCVEGATCYRTTLSGRGYVVDFACRSNKRLAKGELLKVGKRKENIVANYDRYFNEGGGDIAHTLTHDRHINR